MLLEFTEKYLFTTEDEAELLVEKKKQNEESVLLDWKISKKETKKGEYCLLTTKERLLTLEQAKEKIDI